MPGHVAAVGEFEPQFGNASRADGGKFFFGKVADLCARGEDFAFEFERLDAIERPKEGGDDDENDEIREAKKDVAVRGDGEIRQDCPNDNEDPNASKI